jgi:hypothetical protein
MFERIHTFYKYIYIYMYEEHNLFDLPLRLSIDLVTEGHDELPVLIAILRVGGLLCVTE